MATFTADQSGNGTTNGDLTRPKVAKRSTAVLLVSLAVAVAVAGVVVYGTQAPDLDIVHIELAGAQQAPLPASLVTALAWDLILIGGYGVALFLLNTVAIWAFWNPRARLVASFSRGAVVVAVVFDLLEDLALWLASRSSPEGTSTAGRDAFLEAAAAASTIKWIALIPAVAVAVVGVAIAGARLAASLVPRYELVGAPASTLGKETLQRLTPFEQPAREPKIRPDKTWNGRRRDNKEQKGTGPGEPAVLNDSGGDGVSPPQGQEPPAVTELLKQGDQEQKTAPGNPAVPDDSGDALASPEQPPATVTGSERWARAYHVPSITEAHLAERSGEEDVSAVCLSGGGIRSASLALGALQSLREELGSASYLVSVSGGGYTAGAYAQLLTDAGDEAVPVDGQWVHDSDEAFSEGSVEFDHVRRNSSYLASNGAQMFAALGVVARGLLASLVLLFAPALTLGVAAAWFYRVIPLAELPGLATSQTTESQETLITDAGALLHVHSSTWAAVTVVATLALVSWLAQVASYSNLAGWSQQFWAWSARASVFLTRLALLVVVVAVGIPAWLWVCGWIIRAVDKTAGAGAAIGASSGAVLLTFLVSLSSLAWRQRKTVQDALGAGAPKSRRLAIPGGLLQQLLVILTVVVLTVGWLLLFGITAIATVTDLQHQKTLPSLIVAGSGAVVVFLIGGLFDEASLSLHPFYRRRLATAFATRTATTTGTTGNPDGHSTFAVSYGRTERTTLSTYARPAAGASFPEFVFAASANLTGENRTPPGLTAVSFTMGADWVGGPDVGWVRTQTLEQVSPSRLRRDVTVQAAVAISGAAIASAMGRQSRWFQILFAVSGARLGAWLPNPVFLLRMREARDQDGKSTDWTVPGLPRVRRMTYLLREVFDIHPIDERLLLVTDGGHYENLGIVEALRRRASTIYCIDGGGDTPPTAHGLAEAIALARNELGVTFTLAEPLDAEPGAGAPLEPQSPFAGLNSTLTRQPIITGTYEYPAASGLPDGARKGRIYVARALLWPGMSYPLLSHAVNHPVFPHDSTGDQWFDDAEFTAYTQLGRELGDALHTAALAADRIPENRRNAFASGARLVRF